MHSKKKMKCPNCKKQMEKVKFDVGYNIDVDSLHCKSCGFNVTDDKVLKKALLQLREQMSKKVKLIQVGEGLGIRLPNEIVKNYRLKKGKYISLTPEEDGFKASV